MAKYRKKPVVVEAVQWFKPGDVEDVGLFAAAMAFPQHLKGKKCKQCDIPSVEHGWMDTLEGGHIVCPSDFIITGVKGEKYPCKENIFHETYDPVAG